MTAHAYVLVNAQAGRAEAVRQALQGLPGVHSADLVVGPHDLVLRVEAGDLDAIAGLVLNEIHGIPGVVNTLTYPVVAPTRST